MHLRDSLVLTSLLLATACPASPATTTASGTTDGDASSGGTTGPTTGTDAPTTGTDASTTGTDASTTGTTADPTSDPTESSGTTGDPPALPETCADVLAGEPGAADGEYTLYVGKDADRPWPAYCHDMAGTPAEYLALVNVADGRNFSQYTNADPQGEDLRTTFTRVRIDPKTLIVDIDDLTFSTSTGEVDHGGPVTTMPYGVAESCDGPDLANGLANIDLVGTPFKVADTFCTAGSDAAGDAVLSSGDQVVDLTGGGNCGWTGPSKGGNKCVFDPQTKNSGFVLELAYIGGSQPLIAETCAAVKAAQPGATDGEYTLYVGGDEERPWTAHCKDMATTPIEYLPLVNVEDDRNYSHWPASDFTPGTDLTTRFTRLRIDPITLQVDIDDRTFSESTGEVLLDGKQSITEMPYGVALSCTAKGLADSTANIDLVGTPFKVIEPFCIDGSGPAGEAVFSANDQVVDLTGGGYCGWNGAKKGDTCIWAPQNFDNGFALDLAYVDP